MKKRVTAAVMIFLVLAAAAGFLLWLRYIDRHTLDRDGMENPFPPDAEPEETQTVPETAELASFSWYQNAMSYGDCFTFEIQAAQQSAPTLRCDYTDWETGERITLGDDADEACPTISQERWTELADYLRSAGLPAYRPPEPDLADAADSRICAEGRDGGGKLTCAYSGAGANGLRELLQDIAGEAYGRKADETEE